MKTAHRVLAVFSGAALAVGVLVAPPAGAAPQNRRAPARVDTRQPWKAVGQALPAVYRANKPPARTLTLTVKGLPKTAPAVVKVKGPKRYAKTVRIPNGQKTLRSLRPGAYRITAGNVIVAGTRWTGEAKPRKARVSGTRGARVALRYTRATRTPAPSATPTPPVTPSPSPAPSDPGTPKPVQQWVDPGITTTVSAGGGYALTIPAGALQARSLVSVTPLPPVHGVLPTMDAHIDGLWSGDVTVTLPWRPPDDQQSPLVLHSAADGLRLSSGSFVRQDQRDGLAVVATDLNSLSPTSVAYWACQGLSASQKALNPACQDNNQLHVKRWYDVTLPTQLGQAMAAESTLPCGAGTATAWATGKIPARIGCTISMDGSTGRFAFTNNSTDDIFALWSSGAVYKYTTGAGASSTMTIPGDVPWLMKDFALATKGKYLIPENTLTVSKTKNSATTSQRFVGDAGATAIWYFVPTVAAALQAELQLAMPASSVLGTGLSACAGPDITASMGNCIKDAINQFLDVKIEDASLVDQTKTYASVAATLLKAMDAAAFYDSYQKASQDKWKPDGTAELNNMDLVDPPTTRGGNDWIARNPNTGRSLLITDGVSYQIPDGGTFNCLAESRVVWDIHNLKVLQQSPPGSIAGCVTSDQGNWTYTPTAQGGNTGTDIILRSTNGNAWLINSSGEIQTIPDGGTYLCLAATNPVIWNTPDDNITTWKPVGVEPAACGPTDPLPVVSPAPFSKLMSTYLSDQSWVSILQPAANGWWLMAQTASDSGKPYTYQWIGPDGRQGPNWTSAVAPVAMATVDGTVFVTDGSRLYRAGSNRFERSTGGSAGWGGGQGTLQAGAEGFLYWLQESESGGSAIIRKINPADLSLNGIVRISGSAQQLVATERGLVAHAPNDSGEMTWSIPYASFTAGVETDAPIGLGSRLPDEQFTVISVGLDGGIAEAGSSDTDCTADVGYRSAAGAEWRKTMQQLLGADYDPNCALGDFDSLPDGGVVFTLLLGPREQHRGYLLEVSASGVRQRLTQVINLGVGSPGASEVADDGTVVTTAQVNWDCPEDQREPGNYTCGDTRVIGTKNGQQQFTTTWTSPTALITPFRHAGNGSSGIYIGQDQVAAWVVQSCPDILGTIGCQTNHEPNQEEAFFRTMAVPMNLPLRSGYIPR